MQFSQEFIQIPLEQLHREAALKKAEGWRFIQTHAVKTDDGVDLFYSFMKNGAIVNLKVVAVQPDQPVPSITDLFLAAFVFENEARELFGIDMRDIAIDFGGAMYAPALSEPMTILSPEMKAARDKARKAQAAQEAKESAPDQSGVQGGASTGAVKRVFVMTPERRARLDAKLATMSPEKVAKVEAALKAREAEAAAAASGAAPIVKPAPEEAAPAQEAGVPVASESSANDSAATAHKPMRDVQLERTLDLLGKDKADKIRAAMSKHAGGEATSTQVDAATPSIDADLQAKIALLDDDKAAKVRAAIAARTTHDTSSKGGE